jgi:hypothetical protein
LSFAIDGQTVGRGEYEFIQLPSPGDRIFLHSHGIGPTEIVRVLYAEHRPVVVPKQSLARPDPTVSLIVEAADEF